MNESKRNDSSTGTPPDWTLSVRQDIGIDDEPDANSGDPAKAMEGIFYINGGYYRRDDRGHFVLVSSGGIRSHLATLGVGGKSEKERAAIINGLVLKIQSEQNVDYAGGLAGHRPGMIRSPDGKRILVSSGALSPEPREGDFPSISQFLEELLGPLGIYVCCLIKVFLEGLREVQKAGAWMANPWPVPILALVGPAGCGKSLLIKIIQMIAGGRIAHPLQFFLGQTSFNYDLVEAELLAIDDESASKDVRDRHLLTAKLKATLFAGDVRSHPKGGKAVALRPYQICVFCCNDEPECMQVLPIIDASMEDKILLLPARRSALANAARNKEGRQQFLQQLQNEVPAFMHHLMQMDIPPDLVHPRTGFKCYQDKQLMDSLREFSPEERVLEVIDSLFERPSPSLLSILRKNRPADRVSFDDPEKEARELFESLLVHGTLVGTASQLELLVRKCTPAYECTRLFPRSCSLGQYLSRIRLKHPGRVQQGVSNGRSRWTIHPPLTPKQPPSAE